MRRRFSASGPWFQAATKAAPTTGSPVGRDACGLGRPGGPVWRGVGAPPYGPGQTCAVGAASSRPKRPPFPAVPPLNAVGRHALMPPWPGPVDRKPDGSAGAVWAHMQCAPTAENGIGYPVGADYISARSGPRIPTGDSVVPAGWFGGVWAPRPTDRRPGPLTQKRRVPLGTHRLGKKAYSTTLVINP